MSAAGLPSGPISAVAAKMSHGEEVEADRQRLGLSPRQQVLDKLWAWYRTEQYSARTVAWDGSKAVGMVERDTIALAGYVPPGFYIANSETLPVAFRRPTAPRHLVKVIVDRFTSLLFSSLKHPRISVVGDKQTEDFLSAIAEEGRLWPAMMAARAYGGATGTAVVGFKLLQGRPVFEVFDPRWATPRFVDRQQLVLSELDYRYVFVQEVRDAEAPNGWREVEFWYRRKITTSADILFEPVPATEARPQWTPANVVEHKLGFCPVAWIQNMPNATDLDGDPDCLGVYELAEAVDGLLAQGHRGTLANADPTLVMNTDQELGEVRKGSSNALKFEKGGGATYLEMTGNGVKAAREMAAELKDAACEIAQCVLELPAQSTQMTATEIQRRMAPMYAKAGILREQYGELGVKRLLNMIVVAAKRLTLPREQDGKIVRNTIALPDKVEVDEQTGAVRRTPRQLGPGPYQTTLAWPPYDDPSPDDATKATTAATAAKTAGIIDRLTAVKYVAPFFGVEDPQHVADLAASEEASGQDELERQALSGGRATVEHEDDDGGAQATPAH